MDLNDIDLERWREILPLAAELIHGDAEIMTQSPSQTVSIYEALAEILSKPTESLNLFNNKSTDRTLFSEAPISSTSTTSTTTTTSTTSKYDDTKVDRVKDTPVNIQTISKSFKSHNPPHDTTQNTSTLNLSDLLMSFDESTNHLIWTKFSDTNNETNGTHHPNIDLMTKKVWNNDMEMTSSSFYPVYVPLKIPSTTEMSPKVSSTTFKNHRVIYSILPNNTIEKKILRQHKGHEDIIHTHLKNGTIMKKFRNGTKVPDDVYIEMTPLNPDETTKKLETVFLDTIFFSLHTFSCSACTIFCVSLFFWAIRSICLSSQPL